MARIARTIAAMLCLLSLASTVFGAELRSRTVTAAFQRVNPCPSTGKIAGACPGFIKDHVTPLCAGGADSVSNIQWQTIEDAKTKDRSERAWCRALKDQRISQQEGLG